MTGGQRRMMQNPEGQTEEQLRASLKEIEALEADLEAQAKLAEDADPFWTYRPSTGELGPEARKFLEEYLRPEDIPQKLDGQMDVHLATCPVIGASGGNQSGKTTVGCIEAFIKTTGELPLALRQGYPKQKLIKKWPVHVRVVGEDYVNGILLNLIPTYRKWVPRDFLLNKTWEKSFSAEQSVLQLGRHGSLWGTIEFMSNKQDLGSFQGPPRHKVIYDEEPREDIRKENLFRFTTASALDELYCMTPTKGLTWVYDQLVSRAEAGESEYVRWFRLPSVGNKLANRNVLEEILKGEDSYEARKMRILGEFISLSGLIYGRAFHRDIHMIPPFELNPRDWTVYRGLDPHTSKPSVCVEMAVNREGQRIVVGALKKACNVHEFKALMAQRARDHKYRLAWTRCDKSANSVNKLLDDQNVFLMLQRGENAVPALMESQKYTGSIHAGVEQMREDLKINPATGKPTLMFFDIPELQPLARSFQTLEREKAQNEETKGLKDKIAEGRHDEHAALRYIYQGRPQFYPAHESVPEYEPVNETLGY
jgi:hypothetical protein